MPEAKWRNPGQTEVGEAGVVAIALIPVVSSQLAAVGYDEGTLELVIRFRASRRYPEAIYSYDGVPPELARALLVAESPGSYFHRHIRHGSFPYRRHQSGAFRDDEPGCWEEAPCGCPIS
jgi:hypothetical protein